jgi:hypothetical protein
MPDIAYPLTENRGSTYQSKEELLALRMLGSAIVRYFICQAAGNGQAGELDALVGVENLGTALHQHYFQGPQAELMGMHAVLAG